VTVVGVLVLGRWDQADLAVQSSVVEPVDVLGDSDLEVVDVPPRALVADEFGLEEGVEGLGQCVVVGVATGADRGDRAGLGEALGVPNGDILNSAVRVMNEAVDRLAGVGTGPEAHLQGVEWKHFGIQPHRSGTFTFSTDPELHARVRDIAGLYLHPPEKAIVLCVDEKSQIQALDRTAPILPLRPGLPESRTHDYVRHGTTTLFAALEVATGRVVDACFDRHRHQEFLRFLRQVAKAYPRRELHVVCENYASHKHPAVKAWLAKHPRITLHFTPTSGSWMNLVEVFFGIITRQAIRRGTFTSVADLETAIGVFIDAWNQRCQPFTWTKDADSILAKATPPKNRNTHTSSETRH
jgi:transposase